MREYQTEEVGEEEEEGVERERGRITTSGNSTRIRNLQLKEKGERLDNVAGLPLLVYTL